MDHIIKDMTRHCNPEEANTIMFLFLHCSLSLALSLSLSLSLSVYIYVLQCDVVFAVHCSNLCGIVLPFVYYVRSIVSFLYVVSCKQI